MYNLKKAAHNGVDPDRRTSSQVYFTDRCTLATVWILAPIDACAHLKVDSSLFSSFLLFHSALGPRLISALNLADLAEIPTRPHFALLCSPFPRFPRRHLYVRSAIRSQLTSC